MSCACCVGTSPLEEGSEIVIEKMVPSVAKKPQLSLPLNEVQEVHPGDELKSKITFSPLVDIFFDPKEEQIVFLLDVPGAAKEDICIEVGDGLLSVSGPRSKTELKEKYGSQLSLIAHERNTGFFCRCFQLPFNALEDTVAAQLNGGVLEVKIKCVQRHEKKKIDIGSGEKEATAKKNVK